MNTFPPIHDKRVSCVGTVSSRRTSRNSHTLPTGLLLDDAGRPLDDSAVNQSRAQASRIRGGYRESDSVQDMHHRIRMQFLRRRLDTESCGQLPLVFPPALPSRLRPEQPQASSFSRGIRLIKTLRRTGTVAGEGVAASITAAASPARETIPSRDGSAGTSEHRRPSVASTNAPQCVSGDASAAMASSACSPEGGGVFTVPVAAYAGRLDQWNSQTPPLPPPHHFSQHPSAAESSTAVGLRLGLGAVDDAVPLHELASAPEQWAYLFDLEACSRERIAATEAWDRQVACEMMMVHYVTFMLKPEMEELLAAERAARGVLRFDEEKCRYDLCQTSEMAVLVREGAQATRARVIKLARLERVNAQLSQPRGKAATRAPTIAPVSEGASSAAGEEDGDASDARSILQRYVEMRHRRAVLASVGAAGGSEDAAAPSTTEASPRGPVAVVDTAEDFRRAADNAGACRTKPKASDAQMPQPLHPVEALAARRVSGAILSPFFGTARAAPRRNTLGIANYMTLLDEVAQRRDLIAQAEEELRSDILTLAKKEWNAVRGWQHKRLHLERLLYWREAKEKRELDEVAALTDVGSSESAMEARAARNALATAVGDSIIAEEDARTALLNAEREAATELSATAQRISIALLGEGFLRQHCSAFSSALAELLEIQAQLTVAAPQDNATGGCGVEAAQREGIVAARDAWATHVATPRAAVLLMLNDVCHREPVYAATLTLQRAFRRSLRGHLGWRPTHRRIGEDVRCLRTAKTLRKGREQLLEMQGTLDKERAALEAEILAEHVAAQQAILDDEFNHRMTAASQEGWTFASFRRQFVDEYLSDILQPRMEQCLRDEVTRRTHLVVEEEVRRDQALAWNAKAVCLVTAKDSLRATESVDRKSITQVEGSVFMKLWYAEQDDREDIRLAAHYRVLACREAREVFMWEADREIVNLAESLWREHLALTVRGELELLESAVEDSTWRDMLAAQEATERGRIRVDFEKRLEGLERAEAEAQRLRNTFEYRSRELSEGECASRQTIREAEVATWEQMMYVDFYNTPNGETIRTYHQQRAAVEKISDFYAATRDREIGRTATLWYLHDAFAIRRELGELKAIRARQRAHVRAVQKQLEEQEEEERADAREACQFLMDIVATRTEPRERGELEATEAFLRQLIFDNHFRHTEDGATAEAELSVSQRIDRELLARLEKRERDGIVETWAEVFDRYFVKEKSGAEADAQARAAQRAQRDHQRHTGGDTRRLVLEESVARVEVEMAALAEAAIDIGLPSVATAALLETTQTALPTALEGLCLQVHRASLEAQELSERVALLWEMRYALCDDVLCSEEARARRQLVAAGHTQSLEQAQLSSEESLQRELLYRERTYFLLRILTKEEMATRHSGIEAEAAREAAAIATFLSNVEAPEPAADPSTC